MKHDATPPEQMPIPLANGSQVVATGPGECELEMDDIANLELGTLLEALTAIGAYERGPMPDLNVGRSAIYDLIRSRRLRTVKIGARRLVPREAIDEAIALLIEEATQ